MDYEKIHNLSLELGRKLIEKNPELREWVESKLPELSESEDETTRKAIIEAIKYYWSDDEQAMTDCLAYLEKQKPNIELIQRSWYLEGYHDREFGKEPMWIIKTGEGGPKYLPNPKYGQPLADKQKPAEWNDTDMKEARDNLITCCRDWERGERTTLLPIVAVRARYFLEHLIEQKPAWSEEDETIIEGACNALEIHGHTKLAERLKSLRPVKQEWSEENERIRQGLIEMYKNERLVSVPIGVHAKDIIRFLENLHPSWKPSEEQMGALEEARKLLHNEAIIYESNKIFYQFESLIRDLYKL